MQMRGPAQSEQLVLPLSRFPGSRQSSKCPSSATTSAIRCSDLQNRVIQVGFVKPADCSRSIGNVEYLVENRGERGRLTSLAINLPLSLFTPRSHAEDP
jgi:hypothetical protein